ncbi:MAG: hypothetical protein SP1CHLAM42_05790 [Chlamydiales bacterium]|nr:hypothetical protein [Chlamydiales bacterium]
MVDFCQLFKYHFHEMEHFISTAFTLFLVIDSLGTLPAYLSQVEKLDSKRCIRVAIRELIFALILMVAFFYLGQLFLNLLGLSKTAVEISGGVVLFLIATRLIFSNEEHSQRWKRGKPFIVPIATPLLAGPSFVATVTIFGLSDVPNDIVLLSLLVAWFLSGLVYLFGRPIFNLIRARGLLACQRLMGLLISLVAVQMILEGVRDLMQNGL